MSNQCDAEDIISEIERIKVERKEVKRRLGKKSVEYAELTEELGALKDSLEFHFLHY